MNFSITPNFQMKFLQLTHFNSVENTIKIRDYLRRFFFFFFCQFPSLNGSFTFLIALTTKRERDASRAAFLPGWDLDNRLGGGVLNNFLVCRVSTIVAVVYCLVLTQPLGESVTPFPPASPTIPRQRSSRSDSTLPRCVTPIDRLPLVSIRSVLPDAASKNTSFERRVTGEERGCLSAICTQSWA